MPPSPAPFTTSTQDSPSDNSENYSRSESSSLADLTFIPSISDSEGGDAENVAIFFYFDA